MILGVHEAIIRLALGGRLAPAALGVVIAANKRSDLHQCAAERHFDNGPDRAALCALWRRGLSAYMGRALARCAPPGDSAHRLANRRGALRAFGLATHALADFYAHTNWVELAVARGDIPTPAPLLGETLTPANLPEGLQSGYFSLRHGLSGCPHHNGRPCPPAGFTHCHAQLNKDAPHRGHGAERSAPGGPTYHELAVDLAISTTRDAWQSLIQRLHTAYGAERGQRISLALAFGR